MSLQPVIKAYTENLPPGELEHFRVDGLDRIGVPVVFACHRQRDGSQFDSFGYGASFDQALVGVLGELAENVQADTVLRQAERVRGSYDDLVAARGERGVCDPLTLCLPAGSDYAPDKPLTWVAARRFPSGEPVLVPYEFAACYRSQLDGIEPLATPITNGLGAGDCFERALVHGLLELLQRDGNCTGFRAMDQGRVLDLSGVRDPDTLRLLAHLDRLGIDVIAKLAATDFGLVNLYVVGSDRDGRSTVPIMQTACGEACDLDRERALNKALLEFCSSRSRKAMSHGPLDLVERIAPAGYLDRYRARHVASAEEPRAVEAMAAWCGLPAGELRGLLADTVLSRRTVESFADLPSSPADTPAARLERISSLLAEAGFDILYLDLSPPDGAISAVKAIVPGLECETMSYHRIGERGICRLMERGSPLAGVGTPPEGAAAVPLPREAVERLGGPGWLDTEGVDRIVGRLYPLYREPESHAVRFMLEAAKT
ncbi:YcaO-like family protein [Skermanella sp. TT6]|uniref:YcaO-like family protein n=1 Tax=Skermanella cutis TaxID=2775420 RepID=A0ABX7B872_9PROT|nr:YcaO-like family protein [Skermanella sp. TT6]QQP90532.1 YcaO-like family protein [Skermanella sp. TT6]